MKVEPAKVGVRTETRKRKTRTKVIPFEFRITPISKTIIAESFPLALTQSRKDKWRRIIKPSRPNGEIRFRRYLALSLIMVFGLINVLLPMSRTNSYFSDMQTGQVAMAVGVWDLGGVLINKVYAYPDADHGDNVGHANEWVELFNTFNEPVNISGWVIGDDHEDDVISSENPAIIPPKGYALITGNSSTWQYWQIPDDTLKIVLDDGKIGDGLNDDADVVVLKNTDGDIVDEMNWGNPDATWHYYGTAWKPGVAAAGVGEMLARVPTGFDTNQPSDFKDLKLPTAVMVNPVGGEVWYVGDSYYVQWAAKNNNGPDNDLKISLSYSADSGITWAQFASDLDNTGSYFWRVPLFIGGYYVPSHTSRIKVVVTGPENFMVQIMASSQDFCPPIDFDKITDEERAELAAMGIFDNSAFNAEATTSSPSAPFEPTATPTPTPTSTPVLIDGSGSSTSQSLTAETPIVPALTPEPGLTLTPTSSETQANSPVSTDIPMILPTPSNPPMPSDSTVVLPATSDSPAPAVSPTPSDTPVVSPDPASTDNQTIDNSNNQNTQPPDTSTTNPIETSVIIPDQVQVPDPTQTTTPRSDPPAPSGDPASSDSVSGDGN